MELWETLDWGKRNEELAEEMGCSAYTVATWRKKLGKPKAPRKYYYDWDSADWTKSNGEIADQLGCSSEAVALNRKRLGMPTVRKYSRKVRTSKYDWGSVDWSKYNSQIAKQLGCSRELVRQRRKRAGLPSSKTIEKPPRYKKQIIIDPTKTRSENAEANGVSLMTLARRMHDDPSLPKPAKFRTTDKYDWSK